MDAPETVYPPDPLETDKTGETDLVGNGEFLQAVFGDDLADARPVVVSFAGSPDSAPKSAWFGRAWSLCRSVSKPRGDGFQCSRPSYSVYMIALK